MSDEPASHMDGTFATNKEIRESSVNMMVFFGSMWMSGLLGNTMSLIPAGQRHHAITKGIEKALNEHPNLKGLFNIKDPNFITRAIDNNAHRGYQAWHRNNDIRVQNWINS